MSPEKTIRSFYDAVSAHDVEKVLTFFADEGHFNDVSTQHDFKGKKELRGMVENWFKALPDIKLKVSNLIGSGDIYCTELAVVGTHTGPLAGGPAGVIPASGKKVNVPSCDVIRLKNGKIQSLNCYFAGNVLLGQIGAMSTNKAA